MITAEEEGLGLSPLVGAVMSPERLPPLMASGLWVVSEATGLLPTRRPLSASTLPAGWGGVSELVRLLPSARVPPAALPNTYT